MSEFFKLLQCVFFQHTQINSENTDRLPYKFHSLLWQHQIPQDKSSVSQDLSTSDDTPKSSLLPELLTLCVCVCVCVHAQSSPSLWCPVDCSPPGSSVHGISQAGILEWAAISSSLPDPGIQPGLLHLLHQQADSLPMCHLGSRVSDQLAIHWRFPWLSSWVWLIC